MKKFKLLLLDANVVIYLFRLGLWEKIIEVFDVYLSGIVIDEADYYEDDAGKRQPIDAGAYAKAGKIRVFDTNPAELDAFRKQFDLTYFDKLDPGETESLVFLLKQDVDCRICSADRIVFRVLGNIRRSDAGVSLEEVLQQSGLGRTLPWQFTKAFREQAQKQGFSEGMRDLGLKK